jgi:uncharacterized protein involved in exopolysaccharide biosynthesis
MDYTQDVTPDSVLSAQIPVIESVGSTEKSVPLSLRITYSLRLFWVRRWMVLCILATGIVLSGLYAFYLPAMYTSSTTLMPPDSASTNSSYLSLMSSGGAAAAAGSALLGLKTPGSTFIGIMKSRTVQIRLVNRFNLVSEYKSKLIEDACRQLATDTQMEEDSKSGIITISVDDRNPVLASKIAQGYVEELDRVVSLDSTSSARRERVFLEGRLKEIKQDLDDSSKALSQFSTKSKTIDIPSQGRAMVDSGLRLQDEMVAARSDLAGLRQSYSEDNVRIRAAKARIAELQRQIEIMMGTPEESKINADDSAYPSVSELPALGLTYADLDRKVLVEEALWEALTKQYEAAKVQEAKEIPTVRVLDAANVPQHKSYPVRRDIVLLGAILSIFAACILVLILSYWEDMDAQDERKQLTREIVNTTANSLAWVQRLPGMRWVYTRLKGSERFR